MPRSRGWQITSRQEHGIREGATLPTGLVLKVLIPARAIRRARVSAPTSLRSFWNR
jgi:hypothetical protein